MSVGRTFLSACHEILQRLDDRNSRALEAAGRDIAARLDGGGHLFTFGCGHSGLVAMDLYYRAGGLKNLRCIFDRRLMLDWEPVEATSRHEKEEGWVGARLHDHAVGEHDAMIVVSTSGVNAVPLDVALQARQRGALVVAISSWACQAALEPRHSSGLKLFDVADHALDNLAPYGDTIQPVGESGEKMGSASTAAGSLLAQALAIEVHEAARARGLDLPVFVSGNVPGGPERNASS